MNGPEIPHGAMRLAFLEDRMRAAELEIAQLKALIQAMVDAAKATREKFFGEQ